MGNSSNIYRLPNARSGTAGSGSGGGMSSGPTWKDYIDQGDASTRAQNDARFAEVVSGLDKIGNLITTQAGISGHRFDTLDEKVGEAAVSAAEAKTSAANTKWNILATGFTVVALVFAGFALWGQAVEMTTGILSSPNGVQANGITEEGPEQGQN